MDQSSLHPSSVRISALVIMVNVVLILCRLPVAAPLTNFFFDTVSPTNAPHRLQVVWKPTDSECRGGGRVRISC